MSARMDAEDNGFAAGLSNCVTRDGQSAPTADLPMGGKRLLNLGAAQVGSDALSRDAGDARYALTNGAVSFGSIASLGAITQNGGQVWYTGNFNPTNYALLTGAAFSGAISATGGTFFTVSTGTLASTGAITQNGNQVWHAGNLTPSNYALISGTTFTGLVAFSAGLTVTTIVATGPIRANTSTNTAAGVSPSVQGVGEFISRGGSAGLFVEDRSQTVTSSAGWGGWYRNGGTMYLFNGTANIASIDVNGNLRLAGNVTGNVGTGGV